MAKIELEGMQELIDRVNKFGKKGEAIKKNTLIKAGMLVKNAMEKKAPRSSINKKHMADHIKMSDIEKENRVDYIKIGPNKGDNSEFFIQNLLNGERVKFLHNIGLRNLY